MNIRQYRYFHKKENEWLSQPNMNPDEAEEYEQAWGMIKEENAKAGYKDIKIEFSEDMYINDEYCDTPEWVVVKIYDEGVLPFKMARGILKAIDGARGIVFQTHFDVDISSEWGGWSFCRLEVAEGSAYLTIYAKHSSTELEINITEQFNQAIGE